MSRLTSKETIENFNSGLQLEDESEHEEDQFTSSSDDDSESSDKESSSVEDEFDGEKTMAICRGRNGQTLKLKL